MICGGIQSNKVANKIYWLLSIIIIYPISSSKKVKVLNWSYFPTRSLGDRFSLDQCQDLSSGKRVYHLEQLDSFLHILDKGSKNLLCILIITTFVPTKWHSSFFELSNFRRSRSSKAPAQAHSSSIIRLFCDPTS